MKTHCCVALQRVVLKVDVLLADERNRLVDVTGNFESNQGKLFNLEIIEISFFCFIKISCLFFEDLKI